MYACILKKFEQNPDLRSQLIATGNMELVEASPNTKWGAGAMLSSNVLKNRKWTGTNKQGQILMTVRDTLKLKEEEADERKNDENVTEREEPKPNQVRRALPTQSRIKPTGGPLQATSTPRQLDRTGPHSPSRTEVKASNPSNANTAKPTVGITLSQKDKQTVSTGNPNPNPNQNRGARSHLPTSSSHNHKLRSK